MGPRQAGLRQRQHRHATPSRHETPACTARIGIGQRAALRRCHPGRSMFCRQWHRSGGKSCGVWREPCAPRPAPLAVAVSVSVSGGCWVLCSWKGSLGVQLNGSVCAHHPPDGGASCQINGVSLGARRVMALLPGCPKKQHSRRPPGWAVVWPCHPNATHKLSTGFFRGSGDNLFCGAQRPFYKKFSGRWPANQCEATARP